LFLGHLVSNTIDQTQIISNFKYINIKDWIWISTRSGITRHQKRTIVETLHSFEINQHWCDELALQSQIQSLQGLHLSDQRQVSTNNPKDDNCQYRTLFIA
jgi:hypothetical protein